MTTNVRSYLEQDSKRKVKEVIVYFIVVLGFMIGPAFIVSALFGLFQTKTNMILFPLSIIAYSVFWLVVIIGLYGKRISRIDPLPNSISVDLEEFENRLAKFNSLPIKQKLVKHKSGFILLHEKSEKTYERFMEITRHKNLKIKCKFKANPETKELLFQAVTSGKYTSNKIGEISFNKGSYIQTSINLLGWNRGLNSPLRISDGNYLVDEKVKGDGFQVSINFLMEICVASGWTWQPVMFMRM